MLFKHFGQGHRISTLSAKFSETNFMNSLTPLICLAAPAGRRPAALGCLAAVGRLPGAKYGGWRRMSAGGGVMTGGAVRHAAIDQHAHTRKTICPVGRPPPGVAWVLVLSRPRVLHLGRASRSTWPSAAPRPGLGPLGHQSVLPLATAMGDAPRRLPASGLAGRPPAALEEARAKVRQHAPTPRASR